MEIKDCLNLKGSYTVSHLLQILDPDLAFEVFKIILTVFLTLE